MFIILTGRCLSLWWQRRSQTVAAWQLAEQGLMPKQKTHKGTKKRFRLTANGKAMHRKSGTSHLATAVSKKRRRNLRGTGAVDACMEASIRAALGKHSS
jgi:large subunit ribosomal protein L35